MKLPCPPIVALRAWPIAVCLVGALPAPAGADGDTEFFERQVRPLLARHCFVCHGAKKQESGLRLDNAAAALKGGVSGVAIVPGNPDQSPLIAAIRRDGERSMPPEKGLSEMEVAILVKWVASGARWPHTQAGPPLRSGAISEHDRRFWSFQRVADPPVPKVADATWCRSPIDRFVLARIESARREPMPRAERRVLIRRASLDLIGLPPSPEEVSRFLGDVAPDAWLRVVDRLLAAPTYGERWARHWLDVVRYCDSRDARHTGQPYDVNEAWRYRDWVVNSLNRDRPYDQFVRQQIAGDCLPLSASYRDTTEGLIASGMLVIGEWGSGDADAKKMLTDMVDDQVHVVSQTFMGVSLSCARCHDHKFDPFSTDDYYRLAGIFFSTQIATPRTDAPLMRVPLMALADRVKRDRQLSRITEIEARLRRLDDQRRDALRQRLASQTSRYLTALWEFEQGRTPMSKGAALTTEMSAFCDAHQLEPAVFSAWFRAVGVFLDRGDLLTRGVADFSAKGVFAWKSDDPQPLVVFNTNTHEVRIPGVLPPRSIAVHPTPDSGVAIAWRSPLEGEVDISGDVSDAHTGGNGVEWVLEHQRGSQFERLASGAIGPGDGAPLAGAATHLRRAVRAGDLLRLIIFAKDNDHSCDLTRLVLRIVEAGAGGRQWSPERDCIAHPSEGNPHPDAYGNAGVWRWLHMSRRATSRAVDRGPLAALQGWFDAAAKATLQGGRVEVQRAANAIQERLNRAARSGDRTADTAAMRLAAWLRASDGLINNELPLAAEGDAKVERDTLVAERDGMRAKVNDAPRALAAQEGGVPETVHAGFQDAKIHIRGDYRRLGAVVARGVPEILAGDTPPTISRGSGRIELARWIANPDHPLTPRVMVNRIWQHHFGDGIVRTPGDFGRQGARPTHPLLLDWLSRRFVESGWSIKALHRRVMSSAVYQQSTGAGAAAPNGLPDPDNRLFARTRTRRLEAEVIRDSLLFVSGQLDRRMGGPSAPRYPGGYSRSERKTPDFSSSRRTLYLMTIRGEYTDGPFVLDAANPNRLVHRRSTSTTAPQALLLMNDPQVRSLARALAQRVVQMELGSFAERIRTLYQLLYARPAEVREIETGLAFLDASEHVHTAWTEYCHALLCTNELIYQY